MRKITKVHRLGKDTGQKRPRPLKFTVSDDKTRHQILARQRKINANTENPQHRIYINKDLTKEQREREKCLREELRERNGEGGGWIIRDGKVVRGDKQKFSKKQPHEEVKSDD